MAEALFQQGRDLIAEGNIAEACKRFAQSQRLEPKLGTLLNLADCHEKEGKTAQAWAEFTEVANLAAKRPGEEKRVTYAQAHADDLYARLSNVTIVANSPPAGLVVSIDGRDIDATMLGVRLPVDPGVHQVAVRASGKKTWSGTLDVPLGPADVPFHVPLLEDAPAPPPAPPAPRPSTPAPGPVAPVPAPLPPAAPEGGLSPLVWVGFGAAGVGLAVGAVTGALSAAKTSDLGDACPNDLCPVEQEGALDTALTLANVSNVAFGLAAAGAVLGVVGLFLDTSPSATESALVLSSRGAGVRF